MGLAASFTALEPVGRVAGGGGGDGAGHLQAKECCRRPSGAAAKAQSPGLSVTFTALGKDMLFSLCFCFLQLIG